MAAALLRKCVDDFTPGLVNANSLLYQTFHGHADIALEREIKIIVT